MSIDIKNLQKELLSIIKESTDRATMKSVSKELADDIKKRTRDGKSSTGNLPELQTPTVRIRKNVRLHRDTSPEKSNLTRGGALLNNIKTTAKAREGTVKMMGKQAEKTLKLEKIGFKFFNASKEESKRVVEFIQKAINKAIRKFNNK